MREPLTKQEQQIVDLLTNLIWYGGLFTIPLLLITYLRKKRT